MVLSKKQNDWLFASYSEIKSPNFLGYSRVQLLLIIIFSVDMGERIQNFGAVSQTFFGFSPSFLHFGTSRLKVGHSLESISDFFEIVSFQKHLKQSLKLLILIFFQKQTLLCKVYINGGLPGLPLRALWICLLSRYFRSWKAARKSLLWLEILVKLSIYLIWKTISLMSPFNSSLTLVLSILKYVR